MGGKIVDNLSVAFLGLGEAGSAIAADLVALGVEVTSYDPLPRSIPGARAVDSPEVAVAGAAVVLSVNWASVAEEVARGVTGTLEPGQLYAELNTASPGLKAELATIVEPSGALFADVALMAPVLGNGLSTPCLVSGSGAEAYSELMGGLGAPVESVGPEAGRAAERKLLRSVFVKGMAAAATEGMAAARAAGCEEWFHGEMVRVFETADAVLLERLLEGSRIHATRRGHEMEAAAEMLRELSIDPRVTTAAVDWLRDLEAENLGRMPADDGYVALREAIVGGSLQPNERLVEARLSSTFGMGRTAVRTALARLEQDGLVERERNRGARVRFVGEREAVEILEARAVLEGLAARHAASNADAADVRRLRGILEDMRRRLEAGDPLAASDENAVLHRTLIEIANHPTVMRQIAMLKSQLVRFQYRTILLPGRTECSFAEHAAIVDAVAAGDPDAAEAAMRRHLSHVADALRSAAGGKGDA